ncbi:MAG: competence/damage-inducible protein A [Bacteroidota bacterium]|nr:competence/damage-inducible protein A [Bacteroidota bacterium]
MICEIITIGDELLIGQVVDTNSAWMASRLNLIGVRVKQITSVSDDSNHIIEALNAARKRAEVILITGGLGPTRDDLTKETLCNYFQSDLIEDQKVVDDLTRFFKSRGRELTATNRRQAEIPVKSIPIYNSHGTAPGMWFEDQGQVFVSMPGVPYEMKAMMEDMVLPKLAATFHLPKVFHYSIITTGVGESFLADLIKDWEDQLPDYIKLAYLPSIAMVKLRLSCYAADVTKEHELMVEVEKVKLLIHNYIFGFNDDTPESIIGSLLLERKETLAIAESCTGGYLSHLVTSMPGCSSYYIGSTISYANKVKTEFLGVDAGSIETEGAVSEKVARAMASGVRAKLGTTWAISTTGIAGPGGGTEEKPVGTVWIGLAGPHGVTAQMFQFGHNRLRNIQATSLFAFKMLRNQILGIIED